MEESLEFFSVPLLKYLHEYPDFLIVNSAALFCARFVLVLWVAVVSAVVVILLFEFQMSNLYLNSMLLTSAIIWHKFRSTVASYYCLGHLFFHVAYL